MDSINPSAEFEHTQEHQEPQEQVIQQDNNVEEKVELVESNEPEVLEQPLEVEEKAELKLDSPRQEEEEEVEQIEKVEEVEEVAEKIELVEEEEEVKPVPVRDTKKSTSIVAQDQKIILNDLEADEDQSPTYKDFFDQEKSGKPSITKVPEKTESNRGSPSSRRWDQLYERAKLTQEKKEKLRKELQVTATEKDDKECTFKPKLNKNSYNVDTGSNENESIHKRTTTWRANKDKKIAEAKEQIKDKDLEACTFKPDTTKTKQGNGYLTQNLSTYGTKGVDLHLKRQIVAKQVREEKETILDNPLQKLPAHVYKKEGNITVPYPPEFNKGKPIEIHALKKPFEFPTPTKSSTDESMSPKKKVESPQKAMKVLVDPVQVNNVRFGHAIQLLHNELHRIKIGH